MTFKMTVQFKEKKIQVKERQIVMGNSSPPSPINILTLPYSGILSILDKYGLSLTLMKWMGGIYKGLKHGGQPVKYVKRRRDIFTVSHKGLYPRGKLLEDLIRLQGKS